MELKNLERAKEYMTQEHGRVMLIGEHPFDGAYLICEAFNEEEDELYFIGLEASDLLPAEGPPQWPHLGHQTKTIKE